MKKKKSKKSKISMQNNELFEEKSERLGIRHGWEGTQAEWQMRRCATVMGSGVSGGH